MLKSVCALFSLLFVASLASAEVFKCVGRNGEPLYQNFPYQFESISGMTIDVQDQKKPAEKPPKDAPAPKKPPAAPAERTRSSSQSAERRRLGRQRNHDHRYHGSEETGRDISYSGPSHRRPGANGALVPGLRSAGRDGGQSLHVTEHSGYCRPDVWLRNLG